MRASVAVIARGDFLMEPEGIWSELALPKPTVRLSLSLNSVGEFENICVVNLLMQQEGCDNP